MSNAHPAVPLARVAGPGERPFDLFREVLAARQLEQWLPDEPVRILDLSVGSPRLLAVLAEPGHRVISVRAPGVRPTDAAPAIDGSSEVQVVSADARSLDWMATESVDIVVAEGGMLSTALAAELTVADLFRVLRPGGRLLLSADSLLAGLAALADQGRWAELADVPAADVVLVPETGPEGVRRCFWPEELHGILIEAGFTVDWIRPRTVLTAETVDRALTLDPSQLDRLVATELALSARRQGESIGSVLVASARRPAHV
ncbi:MAG: class I SAM-dependent methyltransferase [Frankiales bacterium]|nr:class I SAM-dependent methyltransferase [Frankiales bacterium]